MQAQAARLLPGADPKTQAQAVKTLLAELPAFLAECAAAETALPAPLAEFVAKMRELYGRLSDRAAEAQLQTTLSKIGLLTQTLKAAQEEDDPV